MEQIHDRVAGLDVHRDSVTACCRHLGPRGGIVRDKERFTTTTAGLEVLAAWLGERHVELVAMEATGVYWKPPFYALEGRFEVWLCNARHVKKVPGRKTDMSITRTPVHPHCWRTGVQRCRLASDKTLGGGHAGDQTYRTSGARSWLPAPSVCSAGRKPSRS
jgi:hypothetical protein